MLHLAISVELQLVTDRTGGRTDGHRAITYAIAWQKPSRNCPKNIFVMHSAYYHLWTLDSKNSEFESWPFLLSHNNHGRVVHTMCLYQKAVSFGTRQKVVMTCSWEGNSRSGVALCQKLQWFIHIRAMA